MEITTEIRRGRMDEESLPGNHHSSILALLMKSPFLMYIGSNLSSQSLAISVIHEAYTWPLDGRGISRLTTL